MKLLSVIIPIYNVEPYVEKCIRSLEIQDISRDEYEIICVNDGSPDKSREVVLRLQNEFNNIILIDQINQGVSVARNTGADKAVGKYLLFIDPDDYVHENSLGSIIKKAVIEHAQVTVPVYAYIDSDGNVQGKKKFEYYNGKVLSGIEAFSVLRGKGQKVSGPIKGVIPDSSVGIIFEKEFLDKNCLRYVPGVIMFQDVEILARIHCLADRCLLVTEFFYYAVSRKGSTTRSNRLSKEHVTTGFKLAALNLKAFQNKYLLSREQMLFLNVTVVQFVLLSVYSAIRTRSRHRLSAVVNDLRVSGLRTLALEGCKGYHLICGFSYNVSPYLGAVITVLYLKFRNWYTAKLKYRYYKKAPLPHN